MGTQANTLASGTTVANALRRGTQEAAWRAYVARIADGEQQALGLLYDESSSLVYSFVMRVVANPADADEITMDVYTQIWRTASGYDTSRGSVTAWLITLARSRAIDRVRSRASRSRRETALPDTFEAASHGFTPEQQTEDTQRRAHVMTALAALPAEQRELLVLAYYSGLTHSELAERTGQPLGTVKTRIRTGMMKLRESLEAISA